LGASSKQLSNIFGVTGVELGTSERPKKWSASIDLQKFKKKENLKQLEPAKRLLTN
jgi:hypothetical protein